MKAKLKFVRISPFKLRLVADLLRGKNVDEALNILKFTPRRGARILEKVLKSALANATENMHKEESNLYISKVLVDEGPRDKRFRPAAYGRAHPFKKRRSHIIIELEEKK